MARTITVGPSVLVDAGGNKITNGAAGVAASDFVIVSQLSGAGAVTSVFARTGAVVAVNGDYYGVVAAALTGATAASRYAGATASGAPVSGTFAVGDFVIDQAGAVWICTVAGTPGTWTNAGTSGGVASIAKSGSSPLTGAVTLTGGTNVTLTQAGQDISIAAASTPIIGTPELIYRYVVTGSAKSSIDTGVDSPQAGSNDWTNGDLLETWLYGYTDEAVHSSSVNINVNNDTGANYYNQRITGADTTVSSAGAVSGTSWGNVLAGQSDNIPGMVRIVIPFYAGTTFQKAGEMQAGHADTTAANSNESVRIVGWNSTAAITRMKWAPATGGAKFQAGCGVLVYKRRSS